jgi:transposase
MSYSKTERLEIGRKIYENEISRRQAAAQYGICEDTARGYMREYRDTNHLPAKEPAIPAFQTVRIEKQEPDLEDYENMTKEELIDALVMARINVARLKKGYEVKGVGAKKKYVRLESKNTK